MNNDFALVVEKAKAARESFDAKTDAQKVPADIAALLEAARARESVDGIFIGSESGLKQYARTIESKAEVAALVAGTEFELTVEAARKTFALARQSCETLRMPAKSYRGQDEGVRAMLRAADAAETHSAFLSYQGRGLSDLADGYGGSTDADDIVFTVLVENGLADGWRSWPLTRSAADAAAVMRLQKMIAERKAARVPADLVEAEQAIAALMPGTVEARIRLLRDGKLKVATQQTTAA